MGPPDPQTEPTRDEAVDVALRRALADAFGSAASRGAIRPLAGDASSRRYYRITLRAEGGSPPTVVAMVLGQDRLPLSSEELAVFERPPTELPFINVHRFLRKIGIRVPALHHYDETRGIILLEDVGDTTLRAAAEKADPAGAFDLFARAVDLLVRIQVLGSREADPECIAFQQRFDRRLFEWELEHYLDHGVVDGSEETKRGLRESFAPVIDRLTGAPALLAHRDFHSWNLHLHQGELCVLDFQDALLAPSTYDLASLLTDRNTAEVIPPELEDALITRFVDQQRLLGVDADASSTRELYFLSVLQRALKVIGRFRYLALVKGKRAYLDYLPHVIAQARRALDARGARDLERLRSTLSPHLTNPCEE